MKKIIKCKDTEFTIYVEDTDFQGVVYHANYLKYFERSRSEFLFDSGISQRDLRDKNSAFVIKSIKINFTQLLNLEIRLLLNQMLKKNQMQG